MFIRNDCHTNALAAGFRGCPRRISWLAAWLGSWIFSLNSSHRRPVRRRAGVHFRKMNSLKVFERISSINWLYKAVFSPEILFIALFIEHTFLNYNFPFNSLARALSFFFSFSLRTANLYDSFATLIIRRFSVLRTAFWKLEPSISLINKP